VFLFTCSLCVSVVSRIVARSEKRGALLHLDVNTEIYPMHEKEKFLMVLSPTLNYSGEPVTNEAQVFH
jgi:DNA-directed RNA polymerase I, II, and III subunit RPABC3